MEEKAIDKKLEKVVARAKGLILTARPNSHSDVIDFDEIFLAARLSAKLQPGSIEEVIAATEQLISVLRLPQVDYTEADRDLLIFKLRVSDLVEALQGLATEGRRRRSEEMANEPIDVEIHREVIRSLEGEYRAVDARLVSLTAFVTRVSIESPDNAIATGYISKFRNAIARFLGYLRSGSKLMTGEFLRSLRNIRMFAVNLFSELSVAAEDAVPLRTEVLTIVEGTSNGLKAGLNLVRQVLLEKINEENDEYLLQYDAMKEVIGLVVEEASEENREMLTYGDFEIEFRKTGSNFDIVFSSDHIDLSQGFSVSLRETDYNLLMATPGKRLKQMFEAEAFILGGNSAANFPVGGADNSWNF
ncbi:hypothetical protein [Rhizobium ruizarguesonis]|uniref:hypothetical protein n=1 Tax=Rhizobium ruizarguesonis TaxID=2081791 RepID=UPI00102FDAA4|nr:hypothetical protein [Rhizobium ruizarguesonis]TBA29367.1 hypothetical protein ELH63_37115 [Rhizobium ruizarguesonis]TBA30323.1 hypothetical protein ELH62_37995 [Rhizobium ruizarguesonis]